jgi:hypothetical protein
MSCICDQFVHPAPLVIPSGRDALPRQIAGFAEFRRALLRDIASQPALAGWRGRSDEDFGIMLLEMWAYVCDVVAFYDEVIADEAYLRTAARAVSLRKLVALLGYRPRPAVASRVSLAFLVDGRRPLRLPKGTVFRSGAFGSEPPQTFELDADTTANPLFNHFSLVPPPTTSLAAGTTALLVDRPSAAVETNDYLLVLSAGAIAAATVATGVAGYTGADGARYTRVTLRDALAAALPVAGAELRVPTRTAGITSGATAGSSSLTLDGLYRQILPGDPIVVTNGVDVFGFRVTPSDGSVSVTAGSSTTGSTTTTFSVQVLRTVLALDRALPTLRSSSPLIVHHGLRPSGIVVAEPSPTASPSDAPFQLALPVEDPGIAGPPRVLLTDKNGVGAEIGAAIHFVDAAHLAVDAPTLTPDAGETWAPPLALPVDVYGNVGPASRGESVPSEILGAGDASLANQSFTLKKKPLTYLASPTAGDANGLASTLRISVGGVSWTEVASFFGVAAAAPVYVVREDPGGASMVTFGDGKRGARLPSGAAVIASYRFGAGKATPPSGSITQLGKPVKGLSSVLNPVAAAGGDDAVPPSGLRTYAPRSALLLGRAVSIDDLEALALAQPGVRAARAEWYWSATAQQPVVQVWFIGGAGLAETLRKALRNFSEPTTAIDATPATPVPVSLALDVVVASNRHPEDVLPLVRAALTAPETGLLSAERVGIGAPVFRSRVLQAVAAVEGVEAVRGILWNGSDFADYGYAPGAGNYFDLEDGQLTLAAEELGHAG